MKKILLGAVCSVALLSGAAFAQDKKVTIAVSIPAADHGWSTLR